MNDRTVTTVIEPQNCTGCALCISVCTSDTLSLKDKIAMVTGDKCLACGHCMAVCPEGAIRVDMIDAESTQFKTFSLAEEWLGYGKFPTSDLARLIASRRSCRNFSKKPVEIEKIKDLVKLSTFAPSGTNSQKWTFTCLTSRNEVVNFAHLVGNFFKQLNKKAENRLLRTILRLMGKSDLEFYYIEYYESVKEAIRDMEEKEIDRLFHGATACIIVGSSPGASCPAEDAILAAGNILLAAHTMGLGSCMIGFAHQAMKNDSSIAKKLNIPGNEKIHAVIALGYPNERYQTITGRKTPVTRFI